MMLYSWIWLLVVLLSTLTTSAKPVNSKGEVSVKAFSRQVTASVSNPQHKAITCFGKLYAKTSAGETETSVLKKCSNGTCVEKIKLEPSGEFYLYLTVKGRSSTTFVKVWHDIVCVFEKKEK